MHSDDAVPAELEEVLVETDLFRGQADDVGDRAGHRELVSGLWGANGRVGHRVGQPPPIQFPVRQGGHPVKADDRRRNHVVGQHMSEIGTQRHRIGNTARIRHHITDQTTGPDDHHGLAHPGPREQRRLDLTQFDAVPADLDLIVAAAAVDELPVPRPANRVSGPVHPGPVLAERIGHEAFRGQVAATQIAAGQPGTGQVEFAIHTVGYRPQCVVENIGARSVDRAPDDRVICVGCPRDESTDGRLGGPVEVVGVAVR